MAMSRKDFESVAHAIRAARDAELTRHANNAEAIINVAKQLAATFALQHDTFKADVFLETCFEQTEGD